MSMSFLVEKTFQIRCVDKVPAMGKADPVRVVGEKGLVKFPKSAYSLENMLHSVRRLDKKARELNIPIPQPFIRLQNWLSIEKTFM